MADPSAPEQFARIRLLRTERVGPVSYFQLLRRFGTAQAVLDALPDLVRRSGGRAPRSPTPAQVEAEQAAVARAGARYLFHDDNAYPALLGQSDSAPPILIVRGHAELLARPAVAIVGARNASAAACRMARGLAAELAEAGCLVVSGLARGIDSAAHAGVMDGSGAGVAATAGVIASGIDIAYPPENQALQQAMGERALVLAEQPPGTEPLARHFPYRNRIIAGLSLGTVVVEAAPKSGSLITARLAAELGRDVMAVPGSPLDSRSRGCNALIREGATLVQDARDVLEAIGTIGGRVAPMPEPAGQGGARLGEAAPYDFGGNDGALRRRIEELLSLTPVTVDEIIRQAEAPPALVQMVLTELELAGRIERHAGGRVSGLPDGASA